MNKKSFVLILKFIAMIFGAQISSECFLECIWIRKTEGLPNSELKKKKKLLLWPHKIRWSSRRILPAGCQRQEALKHY